MQLTVTPGSAGENAYVARVDDYDSGDPLAAVTAVRLECSLPAKPAVSAVTVPLKRDPDGSWRGRGLELAIAGVWSITVVVEKETGGVTVPLEADDRGRPRRSRRVRVAHFRPRRRAPRPGARFRGP